MRAKSINENVGKDQLEFDKLIADLRQRVFPKLNEDELYEFMKKLKRWTNQMLGETDDRGTLPPPPRAEGGWNDTPRDWRDTGEMGG